MKSYTTEEAEIEELHRIFKLQKEAFNKNPYPSAAERIETLKKLKEMVLKYQEEFIEAMSDDFGFRSRGDSGIGDFLTTVGCLNYCIKNVEKWMKPSKRKVDLMYQPAENYVMYQPQGVLGLIDCWNYPIFESIGHLAFAVSAGCSCIIKGSEFVPKFNEVMRKGIAEFFDESKLSFVWVDIPVATAFTALPFDHLLVTGSPNVGKLVMKAAAENLTPVTLELGGKSPLIIDNKMSIESTVKRFLLGKTMNAGQTCVAPDYVFCPEDKVNELEREIQKVYTEMYPDFEENQDWTHILNERQYTRIQGYVDDAQSKGANIYPLARIDKSKQDKLRKMPLHLATGCTEDMLLLQEEIFGPILPILPYNDIDKVIKYIQDRPRPLALYINSFDEVLVDKILKNTHSGSVAINEATFQVIQDDLPFGGTGNSGMGKTHGIEGFLGFSNARGVYKKGKLDFTSLLFPPFGKRIHKLVAKLFIK